MPICFGYTGPPYFQDFTRDAGRLVSLQMVSVSGVEMGSKGRTEKTWDLRSGPTSKSRRGLHHVSDYGFVQRVLFVDSRVQANPKVLGVERSRRSSFWRIISKTTGRESDNWNNSSARPLEMTLTLWSWQIRLPMLGQVTSSCKILCVAGELR